MNQREARATLLGSLFLLGLPALLLLWVLSFIPSPTHAPLCELTSEDLSRCSKAGKGWEECLREAEEECASRRQGGRP